MRSPSHQLSSLALLTSSLFGLLTLSACRDRGESRRAGPCDMGLVPGDLVITEIMANPAGSDTANEWFEIYNASGRPLDATGLVLVMSKADGSSEKPHTIEGLSFEIGQYAVMGDVMHDEALLPAHVDYGYGNALGSMNNTAGRLAIYCGESLIDQAFYENPGDGVSRGYDGSRTPDASGNDDLTAWCDATTPFDEEQLGTPGGPNDVCLGIGSPTTCQDDGELRDVIAPAPGDLVVSEFHPNPKVVADADGEWLEIYVRRRVDLNGLEIGKMLGDPEMVVGSSECVTVEADSYVVLARNLDPDRNGGLPRADLLLDMSIGNSGGTLVLSREGQLLDQVTYTRSFDGKALNLDPDYLDADVNDDPEVFCAATEVYGDGDFGTPGAPNTECPIAPPEGQCHDGTGFVELDPPALGEVVITEFMANPAVVGDSVGEWFEILATADFHLNGLELGTAPGEVRETVVSEACLPVRAGQYVVFARRDDPALNGGLPPVADTFGFSLVNSNGSLFVGFGGEVLDSIAYPTVAAGAATSLDPAFSDPGDNDDPDNWCTAVDPYGDGDLGTPGAENPVCEGGGTGEGMCNDGGSARAIVSPQFGDLVITEFMADPAKVDDADGEWFEVLVKADVDLNGLQLGRDVGVVEATLPADGDCLAVVAGTRIVFARRADPDVNGGIADVYRTFSFSLINSNRGLWVGLNDQPLDAITYTTVVSPGISTSLDPGSEDPVANDDEENFCASTSTYGAGDRGTPGLVNDACGA